MNKLLLVMLVFAASSAHGEIYTWTDSRGTAHYTNSMYEIPARYRARVKILDLGVEKKTDAASPQQNGPPQAVQPAGQAADQQGGGTRLQQGPPSQPLIVRPQELRHRRVGP